MGLPNSLRISLSLLVLFSAAVISRGMEDPQDAELVREIEDNLIAPCCWSSPVSQHFSEVSEQIRAEVREMVTAGKSREEIMDYYVAKYGERILATPRPRGFNVLAYVLPWTALILGAWFLFVLLKKLRSPSPAADPPQSLNARYAEVIDKEINELED